MSMAKSEPPPQVFRAVYRNSETGSITPLYMTASIAPRFDKNLKEYVILWHDIEIAFKSPSQVWHGSVLVSYLTDENFEFLHPHRISTYPGVALDVVIETLGIEAGMESLSIKSQPTTNLESTVDQGDQLPSDVEPTTINASLPTTLIHQTQNPRTKRAPEDRGEPLESTASPKPKLLGRAPQFIPDYNNSDNDFYDHTQPTDIHELDDSDTSICYKRGLAYYKGQDIPQNYPKALEGFIEAANKGHAGSQSYLGLMYEKGHGLNQDYSRAVEWYQMAANQGDAAGQNRLGSMYLAGHGVNKNYSKAVELFEGAASQGYPTGQNNLGFMYQHGYGVDKDYSKAVEWYQKAVSQGNADGQSNLGYMYQNGYGVDKDYFKAVEWFQKAANQGNPSGQYNLGQMYQNGYGVDKDYSKAVAWYQKAASQENANAQLRLGAI